LGRGDFESIKLINEWLPTLLQDHSPLNDEIPWLTLKAIKWLEKNLKPNMTVFEYGSGGSTIFIAKRVSKIVSVEHDSFWYNKVLEVMKEKSIYNCKYILLEPDEGDFKSEYGYKSYTSQKREYRNKNFRKYVQSIDRFENNFDVILIDGRARPSCIAHAIPKIRPGGYLILDDSQRKRYQPTISSLLSQYFRRDFIGFKPFNSKNLGHTTVWKINLLRKLNEGKSDI